MCTAAVRVGSVDTVADSVADTVADIAAGVAVCAYPYIAWGYKHPHHSLAIPKSNATEHRATTWSTTTT